MGRYVALLRGINVGGKNVIPMADLRACFAAAGYADVATYIQSGNVCFTTPARGAAALTSRIERLLSAAFDYRATVMLRSATDLRRVVAKAPPGFGDAPATYRYDVAFLRSPPTPRAALASVPLRSGVDTAHAGPGVLYFSRLTAKASQSRLSRLSALPLYQRLTVRNWNTTTRLLAMLEGAGPA